MPRGDARERRTARNGKGRLGVRPLPGSTAAWCRVIRRRLTVPNHGATDGFSIFGMCVVSRQVSDFLNAAIDGLSRNAERSELDEEVRALLGETAGRIDEITRVVRELEKLVPLPVAGGFGLRPDFSALPVDAATRRSEILQALFQAGLKTEALGWFTEADSALAADIATDYTVLHPHLLALRGSVPRGKAFSFTAHNAAGLRRFIGVMERHGVAAFDAVMVAAGGADPDAWIAVEAGARLDPARAHMVVYRISNPELYYIALGDWVACHLANLVSAAHPGRDPRHELFTKIGLSGGAEDLRIDNEIEVVALTGQDLTVFDVAHGTLSRESAADVTARAVGLRSVFSRFLSPAPEFRAVVLFDELVNETAGVEDLFTGSLVEPVPIGRADALVRRLSGSQAP